MRPRLVEASMPEESPKPEPNAVERSVALVPRKHGAWAAFGTSILLGIWSRDPAHLDVALFVTATLGVFVCQHLLGGVLRVGVSEAKKRATIPWLAACAALTLAAGIGLLVITADWVYLAMGVTGGALLAGSLVLERAKRDRTLGGELLGMVALTLVLPATLYVVRRSELTPRDWLLWAYVALFFAGSVFRVRLLVRGRRALKATLAGRLQAGGAALVVHVLMLAAAVWLADYCHLTVLGASSLVPGAIFSAWIVAIRPSAPTPIRRVGFIELGLNLAFFMIILVFFSIA
jgi:hypothetical protein